MKWVLLIFYILAWLFLAFLFGVLISIYSTSQEGTLLLLSAWGVGLAIQGLIGFYLVSCSK